MKHNQYKTYYMKLIHFSCLAAHSFTLMPFF